MQFPPGTLFIDCTANGHPPRPAVPVFTADTITMQLVSCGQTTFSTTLIAHLEAKYPAHQAWKNSLCVPVPLTHTPHDFVVAMYQSFQNNLAWARSPALLQWMLQARAWEFSTWHTPLWKLLKYRAQVLIAEPRAIKALEHIVAPKAAEDTMCSESKQKGRQKWLKLRSCQSHQKVSIPMEAKSQTKSSTMDHGMAA